MGQVLFFHNVRNDNARRTGVYADEQRLLDYFIPGDEEPTPALRWYVDVVMQTEAPPTSPAQAREWVAAHAPDIHHLLTQTAERLSAGADTDMLPWTFLYSTPDGPVRVSLSAMRRYDARNVADNLRTFLATDLKAIADQPVPVS